MKNYKTENNEMFAFEDTVPQEFLNNKIKELGLIEITEIDRQDISNQKDYYNQYSEKEELATLQSYLNSSDYVSIHYGELLTQESKTIFLDNISTTFNMSNMNILIKREEARDRIDELRILIEE